VPITIKVNGTVNSLVHKMSNGISTATIPDVCKTPSPGGPVPVPYPNIAQSITLSGGTTNVKGDKMMAANKGSKFALSNGDNAGVAGGVKSSTFMKEATWILYSFDVKLQKKNACRFTDKMFHNKENAANLAGAVNPPITVAEFENIVQDCVDKASDDWDSKNGTPNAAWCSKPANRQARGNRIGEDASACIQAAMNARGNGNEVSLDQSFTRNGGALSAVGAPGQVMKNTVRPDIVFHGPRVPGAPFPAVRGVYDIKSPCPRGSNSPHWDGNQGADYLSMFRQVPRLVSPGNAITTGAGPTALGVGANLLRTAARLMRIPIPWP
jgi:Domain of unknown function (DUF4150)